jgi:SOS response regulatory protein OraA/RecX
MLAMRPRSVLEVRSDLEKKGFSVPLVEKTVADLSDQGWLDDISLAKQIISTGQDMHRGWSRIYADLRRRGINRRLAEESLQESYDLAREEKSIRQIALKNGANCPSSSQDIDIDKLIRRISYRGFNPTTIKSKIADLTGDG